MSNYIQIRRSFTQTSPQTDLNSGELAFSYVNNSLYIGARDGKGNSAIPIAGEALMTNANLSGNPTAPTPALHSNNNSIATTSFVNEALANLDIDFGTF